MPKLLSVNVGLPREIAWQGRVVRTAIWKRPVAGRVLARRLNLDGDGQADLKGHGGEHRAVMVYQFETYRYWERALSRSDFEYGQFGENFTVEGLADDEVCIGDRYRIGSAVFEVTQPRVTCYRLGIRMDNPQMAALLVAHKKPGFYCRVISEGEVGAGDEIQKIADGPGGISVAEVDSLLYTANHDLTRIAIAVRIPALSVGWKGSFESFLEAGEKGIHNGNAGLTPPVSSLPAWSGFRRVKVVDLHRETPEVTSIVFADLEGSPLPPALPGQFVVLRWRSHNDATPVVRSYSISGASDSGTYRISVKRGTGVGSRYLVDATQAGDQMEISAPRGEFILRPGRRPVVLLSAGIGVTPVLSMLRALAPGSATSRREVWWIHAARNGTEHVFAEEARQLLAAIPGSRSVTAYSRPDPTDRQGTDFDIQGRLDLANLEKLAVPAGADFYMCGPLAFQSAMNRDLVTLGAQQDAIHQEVFGPASSSEPGVMKAEVRAPHPPAPPGTGPVVSFTRSGLAVPWDSRFKSILELAEACDVPVRWSCRTGVCHTCECGILDGRLQYAPEPLDRPALGNALICCSTPESAIELDL
ncbi:MAG TPA: MOSC and FAD-binding oxidoreductase domain-containing protein [Acidobacteriaceae bacterium]|nr:MOSC and FAD-binding oxidoreductase domain-containing protein [Acidobacteriaceae bacterium]